MSSIATRPECDDADCHEQSVQDFHDVEVIPPNAKVAVRLGTLRFCTKHARRFVIDGRVNVEWSRLLPKL